MQPKRLHPECLQCLAGKQLPAFLKDQPHALQLEYMQRLMKILSEAPDTHAAPVIIQDVHALRREMFGYSEDFTAIKKYFNELMMSRENAIAAKIGSAKDPLLAAIQYSLIGNYIDFGSHHTVREDELDELLEKPAQIQLDSQSYADFRDDVQKRSRILFLTDNCGEIVMDKLLVQVIRRMNPTAEVVVMVRGKDVLNDATMTDAEQIGLTELVKVVGNGNGIAGTWQPQLSTEAAELLESADLIIAKGQANFETLFQCGKNVYYLFLCKCEMFARRFHVPRLTAMLLRDCNL